MNSNTQFQKLITCFGLAIAIGMPLDSEAAAPVYFDLGRLIVYGVFYLLGLVVFPFAIGISKGKTAKCVWLCLFAAYVIGPVAYIAVEKKQNSLRNTRILEDMKVGKEKNLEAFSNYCKKRNQIVHSKVVQEDGDISIAVRIEKNFTGVPWQFNAYPLFDYLYKHKELCARTGVKVLEGIYDGAYSKEKNGYEKEVRRYSLCTNEKWTVVPEAQSRYELVLGQNGGKDPVPWGGEGGRWMSNSSVQIIDKLTGKTLAEDTMYFLRYDTGEGGCPSGMRQLTDLLVKVFGRE